MYFPEESVRFRALLESLRGRKVAVLGHMRPDGDCIGSQVALARLLIAAGIPAVCVNRHAVPRTLKEFVGDTPFLHETEFKADGHRGESPWIAPILRASATCCWRTSRKASTAIWTTTFPTRVSPGKTSSPTGWPRPRS